MATWVEVNKTWVELLPSGALWNPETRTMFLADTHFGKENFLRNVGLGLVPDGSSEETFVKLSNDLEWVLSQGESTLDLFESEPDTTRVVILGDIWHHARGCDEALLFEFQQWRRNHPEVTLSAVLGNHDQRVAVDYDALGIEIVAPGDYAGGFAVYHEPYEAGDFHLCGHLHPAVRMLGKAKTSMVLRAFWHTANYLVLPAYGDFTGAKPVRPSPEDGVYALVDGAVRILQEVSSGSVGNYPSLA